MGVFPDRCRGRAVVFLLPSREGMKNINWVEPHLVVRLPKRKGAYGLGGTNFDNSAPVLPCREGKPLPCSRFSREKIK